MKAGTPKNFRNIPEWNALFASLGIFFHGIAGSATISYATSERPVYGSISDGIFYACSGIFAPIVVIAINRVQFKYIFVFAAILWSVYQLAYYMQNFTFYIIGSFLGGISHAFLFVTAGTYITQCSNVHEYQNNVPLNSQIGWFKGLYFSIFCAMLAVSYIFSGIYFEYYTSNVRFYGIIFYESLSSMFVFLFLKPMPELEHVQIFKVLSLEEANDTTQYTMINDNENDDVDADGDDDDDGVDNNKDLQHLKDFVFKHWGGRELNCLMLSACTSGVLLEFGFGDYPTFINNISDKFWALAVWAMAGSVTTYICGPLSDKYGNILMMVIATCLGCTYFCVLLYLCDKDKLFQNLYVCLPLSAWLGVFTVLWRQQVLILFAKLLGNQPAVFAKQWILRSFGLSITFFISSFVSSETKVLICLFMIITSFCLLFIHPQNRSGLVAIFSITTTASEDYHEFV